jgi:DAK2 domain fusion protein YloV
VVDAGGAGLVEIARGLVHGASGEPLPDAPVQGETLSIDAIHLEPSEYRYCTVFVVEGEDLDQGALESTLEHLGDSLLVVGDRTALKVHVHTDDPGSALSAATLLGVVEGIEIANMHHQTAQREDRLLESAGVMMQTLETGLVAVCPGRGNRRLFESLGATRVIEGGQSMNPSAAEIVAAIDSVPAAEVIVLPNNSNVVLTAEQAAVHAKKSVRVVPSRSVQAGLAAIGRYVSTNTPEQNEQDMRAVLDSIATGEVTIASRDVELDGVEIHKGDFLGLVDETAVAAAQDITTVLQEVIGRVLAGEKEWLAILTGEGAPPLDGLVAALERDHPGLSIEVHDGGQPHYPLLLVAE